MNVRRDKGLISIIIPVYNLEKYIQQCLNSIVNNSYKRIEIICINDGSYDGSQEIMDSYRDDRIIIINQVNRGVSAARNVGLNIAKGEYIAFVDGDDYIHNKYFEYLLYALKDCGISCCNSIQVDSFVPDKRYELPDVKRISFSSAVQIDSIRYTSWGKLFKREVINKIRFKEQVPFAEDRLFCIEVLCSQEGNVGIIEIPLYQYLKRPGSAVSKTGYTLLCVSILAELSNQFRNSVVLKETYKAFLSYHYVNIFLKNAKNTTQEIKEIRKQCIHLSKKLFTLQERLQFNSMLRFPWLYRAIRIHRDRTLREFEKSVKANQ